MKSYYDTYWEPEDWIGSRFSGRLRRILEKHVRGAAVLDAGCGDGGTYGTWLASVATAEVEVRMSRTGTVDEGGHLGRSPGASGPGNAAAVE